jgi:DNA-binding XRE family transcriptional regulator
LTQVFYWLCPLFGQEQSKVIAMEMLGKVKRLYSRGKLSLQEIAKTTGLSRNTIRKWVRDTGDAAKPAYPPVSD